MTRRASRNAPNLWLLGLSALFMTAGLLGGGALILQNDSGGFFPNLGLALGVLLIGAGNLLSWLVNLLCWCRERPRWLAMVLAVQTLPAVALLAGLAWFGLEQVLEARASGQRTAVTEAIRADDTAALQESLRRCGERCREIVSPQRVLMLASLHGAHRVAGFLIDEGAELASPARGAVGFYNAQTDLHTCEGSYLPSLGALEVAVAREDAEMLALLWPVSDKPARLDALWTAARLDRLAMVKSMTGAGATTLSTLPLVRENFRGEEESLLRAAASGAAVEVAGWLLEQRPPDLPPLALPPGELERAMTDLLGFATERETPRASVFARLLMRHGVDIQAARLDGEPALERALRYRSKALAALLLDLGADPASLSGADRAALTLLLQEPDRPRDYGRNREGCVAP